MTDRTNHINRINIKGKIYLEFSEMAKIECNRRFSENVPLLVGWGSGDKFSNIPKIFLSFFLNPA